MSPHLSIDREAVSAFCLRHHIARLALFGSVLRDDFGPDSDVDVIVEFDPEAPDDADILPIFDELAELFGGHKICWMRSRSEPLSSTLFAGGNLGVHHGKG